MISAMTELADDADPKIQVAAARVLVRVEAANQRFLAGAECEPWPVSAEVR